MSSTILTKCIFWFIAFIFFCHVHTFTQQLKRRFGEKLERTKPISPLSPCPLIPLSFFISCSLFFSLSPLSLPLSLSLSQSVCSCHLCGCSKLISLSLPSIFFSIIRMMSFVFLFCVCTISVCWIVAECYARFSHRVCVCVSVVVGSYRSRSGILLITWKSISCFENSHSPNT